MKTLFILKLGLNSTEKWNCVRYILNRGLSSLYQFVGSVKSIVEELTGKRFDRIEENESRKNATLQEMIIL